MQYYDYIPLPPQKTPRLPVLEQRIKLILICAWCTPETYPALVENQAYTHGICASHAGELLAKIGR